MSKTLERRPQIAIFPGAGLGDVHYEDLQIDFASHGFTSFLVPIEYANPTATFADDTLLAAETIEENTDSDEQIVIFAQSRGVEAVARISKYYAASKFAAVVVSNSASPHNLLLATSEQQAMPRYQPGFPDAIRRVNDHMNEYKPELIGNFFFPGVKDPVKRQMYIDALTQVRNTENDHTPLERLPVDSSRIFFGASPGDTVINYPRAVAAALRWTGRRHVPLEVGYHLPQIGYSSYVSRFVRKIIHEVTKQDPDFTDRSLSGD